MDGGSDYRTVTASEINMNMYAHKEENNNNKSNITPLSYDANDFVLQTRHAVLYVVAAILSSRLRAAVYGFDII